MLAALVPVIVLTTSVRPRAVASMESELRRLRLDVARLSAAVSAIPITPSAQQRTVPERTTIPERTTMLSLPLVRAALQVPVQSANGHKQLIDVTDEALARRD